MLVVRELAIRSPLTPDSPVIINCLTPGACKSDIFRDDRPMLSRPLISFFIELVSRSTEVGSRALVDGIRTDLGAEAHGAFLLDCKVAP